MNYRMTPADPDAPPSWSPVGFDIHAADGTGAILARIRFGGPTTTGAMRDEVLALQAALHSILSPLPPSPAAGGAK